MKKQTNLMIEENLKKEAQKFSIDQNKSFSFLINSLLKKFLQENEVNKK